MLYNLLFTLSPHLSFVAIFLYLFVCQLTSNSDSIFTVEATLVYRMSDAIPNPQYPDEEEGCNNCPRGLQLKVHTLHLLEHSSFNREPVEDVKLTEKNLKASAFSEWQHKHNIWLPVSSPDSSKASKGGIFTNSSSFGIDLVGEQLFQYLANLKISP